MKVDLLPFESWENLNAQIKSTMQVDQAVAIRVYRGLASAVYELAMGTAQFFSHKRSVGIVPGQTPHYQGLLPYLYKEGYEIQFLRENQDVTSFVESLKKDTNFVISCEDHPITGQVFDIDVLDRLLNERKIYHLRISHHLHLFRKQEIQPYSGRICSFDPKTAVALLGPKFKSPPLMAPSMDWSDPESLLVIRSLEQSAQEDATMVKKVESELPVGFKPLLNKEKRIFDRALIYCEELGGEAVQQFLASQLQMEIRKPSWETQIETTHQCRWGGVLQDESWWNPKPSDDVLRGLLILGLDTLKNPGFRITLERALQECRIV